MLRYGLSRLVSCGLRAGGRCHFGSQASVEKLSNARRGSQGLGIPGDAYHPGLPAGVIINDPSKVSPFRRGLARFLQVFLPISGVTVVTLAFMYPDHDPLVLERPPPEVLYSMADKQGNEETLINWSATHEAKPKRLLQPTTDVEVESFLRSASRAKHKLRVIGSGLSPNGMGLSSEGVMTMALLDKVLRVDKDKQQVTVQAGCRVQALVEALAPHGLTLQNFASVREQQIGGFTQVGAHGTGARLPPVDDQVVAMRLVTPGVGALALSHQAEPDLFRLARVGLGALGVVTQATLQCVARHRLVERTFTATAAEVRKNHVRWLQGHQHLRYMWLPYTDTVVVVQADPLNSPTGQAALTAAGLSVPDLPPDSPDREMVTTANRGGAAAAAAQLKPLQDLLRQRRAAQGQPVGEEEVAGLSATQLRDALLACDPLSQEWVAAVNQAEAAYWRRCSGVRVGWSDQILGFDCGGQQWVEETCLPVGRLDALSSSTRDMEFMAALMKEIQRNKVPAPCPIEQRWSCGSASSLSPAHGSPDEVFSWVGVIMYLPDEEQARAQVTQAFKAYSRLVRDKLAPRFNALPHWAKLEVPDSGAELKGLRARLAARYPLPQFSSYREVLDPEAVLANDWLDSLLPLQP
ncbi:hypothetical protein V8C86DRAFT_2908904 [Haematococcus lacustris]